ncbi:uncharacterized protein LOC130824158 [Amaranthus tricolor]|uniref:uncharacterized protein LOC130824158 n=1 Tax=Amaranthus tricolor TaxID=29722 RepID=UPI00258E5B8B|nr:uncharacterized protein LOC130824158 [Amaranthus tricolor]
MARISFRPRRIDFLKQLAIVKSLKNLEDDDLPTSIKNSQRLTAESDNEVRRVFSKKHVVEIHTPQFVAVDTYERDYLRSFCQPTSYIRARGARAELDEFVEYDLDIEDEEWLQEFNRDKKKLTHAKFENLLFKLEVLDHKARERAGFIMTTLGSSVPVFLSIDAAAEALYSLPTKYAVLESVYWYWKEKRERWQKPILRCLQPPPPANDTNPNNVFRPREKVHKVHSTRMQRRENNVKSFEKLRHVRRNLDQTKTILDALIKREEKKRDVMEIEVSLQRIPLMYKGLFRSHWSQLCHSQSL